MLGAFSTDTYLPSFHAIARDFRVGIDAVQQTLTIFLAAMAAMTLFHGTLSDAFGRRPVILVALWVYTLASLGGIFANSLAVLLACRFFQGLSAGAGMVIGRAMIRDLFEGPEAQRVMAYTTVVFGLAPVVAPVLGGWLEVFHGWHAVFVFLTGFGVVLIAACQWRLPESLPPARRAPLHLGLTLQSYGRMVGDPRFVLQSLGMALSSTGLYLYISSAPVFVMQILHLPETAFAWLFAPLITGIMSGALVGGRLAHSWSSRRLIFAGFGIMVAAALANVLYTAFCPVKVPWAILPIMAGTFGMSLAAPAMSVLLLDLYPERRGMASSLQTAMNMGGFALFSGIVAPLLFGSAFSLACGVLAGQTAGLLIWLWGGRFKPQSAGQ